MVLGIAGGTPSYGFDLSFDWCTDSGANGTTTMYVNAGYSGNLTGVNINLSSTGLQQGTFSWGSQDVTVNTSSSNTVTELYVYESSINIVSSDPSCNYYISFNGVGSNCTPTGPVNDYCIKGDCTWWNIKT